MAKKPKAEGEAGLDGDGAQDREMPARIKLKAPHGFVDEDGTHRYWQQGQVVFTPDDVALLVERGADYEPVEA